MIGRWLCRRGRHKVLMFPRPLRLSQPRSFDHDLELAGLCVRCRTIMKWDLP